MIPPTPPPHTHTTSPTLFVCSYNTHTYQFLPNNRKQFANVLKIAFPSPARALRDVCTISQTQSVRWMAALIFWEKKKSHYCSWAMEKQSMAHITQKCPLLCGGSIGTQSLIPPSSKQYAAVYAVKMCHMTREPALRPSCWALWLWCGQISFLKSSTSTSPTSSWLPV